MEKRDVSDNLEAIDKAACRSADGPMLPNRAQNYYVYLVECGDGSLYSGITTDLSRRMAEHRSGGPAAARYTRLKGVRGLSAAWTAPDRSTASKLEYRLKRLTHNGKASLAETADGVSRLWDSEGSPCPWHPVSTDDLVKAWLASAPDEEAV